MDVSIITCMKNVYKFIKPFYEEKHRRFHTMKHIESILELLKDKLTPELELAILFHDVVYNPFRQDNEFKSWEKFLFWNKDKSIDIKKVCNLIMATKDPFKKDLKGLEKAMVLADMSIFFSGDRNELIEYEKAIFYEYQYLPLQEYISKRLHFLEKVKKYYDSPWAVDFLIEYIKSKTYKVGIYAGSFNPYHIGHENIVQQAEQLFDKVIIAQGINREKMNPIESNLNTYKQVIRYSGMLHEIFTDESQCEKYLIRGLRNSFDVNYESNLRNTIFDFKKIPVVYFFCDRQFEHISSSMIRSLYPLGKEKYKKYLVED